MARAALALLVVALVAVSCGGGESAPTPVPTPTGVVPDGPTLEGPASRYAPGIDEVPTFLLVDAEGTFTVARDGYLVLGPFRDTVEGRRLLDDWGYESGYRVQFAPDGLLAGVLVGRYYATVETYLFPTPASARSVFAKYVDQGDDPSGSEPVKLESPLGLEHAAWRVRQGTVGDSNVPAVYYRIVLREGNLVAVVTTFAAEPYANEQAATMLAQLVVERARGNRPATEPTPFPTPSGAMPDSSGS
jgi:hypothetical protein